MLLSIRDLVWYALVPSRKIKTNLTLKWILLQWNYDEYCLRPKECKTSSQKSTLLALALCSIWQQRYDCKGISLWCLSFARFTELRNLDSGKKSTSSSVLENKQFTKCSLDMLLFCLPGLNPFHLRSDAEAPSAGNCPNFSKYHLSWRSQNAAWLPGGRKWHFWETIPSAPHPRISGRPVS